MLTRSRGRKVAAVGVLSVMILLGILASAWAGLGASGSFDAAHSNLDSSSVQRFSEYPLYGLGPSFEGRPLKVLIERKDSAPLPGEEAFPPANFVTSVYADCAPPPNADECRTYPVQVQVWPACVRNLSTYSFDPERRIPLEHERLQLRGVPAAYFADDPRLELYTGTVTVAIFGSDRAVLYRAASALRGIN
jgi:hypothetical protein